MNTEFAVLGYEDLSEADIYDLIAVYYSQF